MSDLLHKCLTRCRIGTPPDADVSLVALPFLGLDPSVMLKIGLNMGRQALIVPKSASREARRPTRGYTAPAFLLFIVVVA